MTKREIWAKVLYDASIHVYTIEESDMSDSDHLKYREALKRLSMELMRRSDKLDRVKVKKP